MTTQDDRQCIAMLQPACVCHHLPTCAFYCYNSRAAAVIPRQPVLTTLGMGFDD